VGGSHSYVSLSNFKQCYSSLFYGFINQNDVFLCSGQSPAEADFNLLDTARKVEVYGIRMYPVKVNQKTNC
jgi:hypothetical protein